MFVLKYGIGNTDIGNVFIILLTRIYLLRYNGAKLCQSDNHEWLKFLYILYKIFVVSIIFTILSIEPIVKKYYNVAWFLSTNIEMK